MTAQLSRMLLPLPDMVYNVRCPTPFARAVRNVLHGLVAGLALIISPSLAADLEARLRWFNSTTVLPSHDVQRQLEGTPAHDANFDVRLMFRHDAGAFTFLVEHTTALIAGDSFAFQSAPQTTLDQTPVGDEVRIADLTWEIDSGKRHRSLHRFDRLALQWRQGNWAVTAGRQAVSWGSGRVFQPMDLFNPFAPTTVDTDFKTGDDLLLVERLFDNGSDLQLLVVGRRDSDERITGQAASSALKWHGFSGNAELEFLVAKHFQDRVAGTSFRFPIGGALLRADLIGTRSRAGDWRVSGVLNLDYSIVWQERNIYLFGELYHNGFGVSSLPDNPALLPTPLQQRLARGELFNVMRNYAAAGGSIQWHPLLTQNVTLISNLHDASSVLQTSLSYDPGDHQRVQLGWVQPLGRAGDEFGGLPLFGNTLTAGGGGRGFLRWVFYF